MAADPRSDAMPAAAGGPARTPHAAAPRPAGGWRLLRRLAVGVAGGGVILVGLVLVPLPGPGWAIVFSGVALLGSEFAWAERLLQTVRRRLAPAAERLRRLPRGARVGVTALAAVTLAGSLALSAVVLPG